MSKKIVSLLLALVLVFAMTACAKTETPAESGAPTETAEPGDAAETPAESEDNGEIYTLNYYQIGNQDTNTREAVQDAVSALASQSPQPMMLNSTSAPIRGSM